MMERILGPFPDRMVRDSKKLKKYFTKRNRASLGPSAGDSDLYRVDWDWDSADGRYVRENCKPLDRYNQMRTDIDHNNLFHLLKVMLDYDQKRRITLAESLRHRFIEPLFNAFTKKQKEELRLKQADEKFRKRNNIKEFKERPEPERENVYKSPRNRNHDKHRGHHYRRDENNNYVNSNPHATFRNLMAAKNVNQFGNQFQMHKVDLANHKSNRGILDKLLANDAATIASYNNTGSGAIPQVKMSNGRTATTGNGKWMRKNGKWVFEDETGPKQIHARLVPGQQNVQDFVDYDDRESSLNSQGGEDSPTYKETRSNTHKPPGETYC